ncbi:uncharacterized protein PITG_03991 [Phytophthora infestans T30-4]|uniref:Uncharacterized protein n=2 Tax=Phytophthora infestans TaxID=4787 RepID=D0MZ21_PHYIT|nr:uncharacterized protein PITG_03991 [Phytophthora infestans T30-4]KAF4031374.1 hypothetical protein GN244_ATG16831 [Phytophthora infestans]EEY66419.1 hypothetical protein PITG_03991 [Phytophthora infestans T30-4]KAF4141775.1 hypothetical protein GN958_ATG09020 [Phytophthora infestans]KAI9995067.1 hypothetical protein PInf_012059 [Phytophthora infestans]KAI9995093.1 hypothetical protein PInf_012137 [Phytophthora infestans]|eukprot:XP_002907018.1 hypothetical protein PITG_03991 [Phytophthora infestans T30-4]
MAGHSELADIHSPKDTDGMMTPPRKIRQLSSPPKISQSRPVYAVRAAPLFPSLDDWSDEEPEDAEPVKPWSQSA